MATVAFCGIGLMGRPMAGRLIAAGHDVRAWNRTPSKARELGGAFVAATPREAAEGAGFAVTMVTDRSALEAVVSGADGLAAGLGPGSVLIEMSTVGPVAVRALREALPDEVGLVDAPVLGSVPAAEEGTLGVLAGGSDADVRTAWPLLEAMGRPRHVGPLGTGAALKLVYNSTLGGAMAALGEALVLAEALGVDRSVALDVLEQSHLKTLAAGKRELIESGDYPPRFTLAMAAKDLGLVADAAREAGVRLDVGEVARRLIEAARDDGGFGDLDYSALVRHLLER
jgi:3-hydroxyisobutyrate dehydrogenase-like beta-hydroxyacid dehydrogenase